METMWTFEIGRVRVVAQIEPCHDLDLSWDDDGTTAAGLNDGSLTAFNTVVSVYFNGARIGYDTLCESIYSEPSEFFSDHRDADPMNRNCTIMRAAKGNNVSICHYFPGMVGLAIAEARQWLNALRAA